jgi:ATP-dependent DNA helicase Rep/DNA helicase-2/ATP-dependent DNA helicase PcrA
MTAAVPAHLQAAEELRDNDEQWQAYQSTGNCTILAGPGSGKTKTITIKIAQLLHEGLRPPRRLACITYSNACVSELRVRLGKLGVDDGNRLLLATVHSFCFTELVLPYAKLSGLKVPDPIIVASEAQSRKLFFDAHQEVLRSPGQQWFRTECERIRRLIPNKNGEAWKKAVGRETRVIEAYETLLHDNGMIDFDGMVLIGLQLVESNPWVRQVIRAKYPVVVIDEYQDLGLPLHRIVLSLMEKAGVRIIAVGDPDQSIYGFTGARPQLLRDLSQLPSVETVSLKLNYRCAEEIIEASKTLLPNPPAFRSHDGRRGEIRISGLKRDVGGQARYALDQLVPKLLVANPTWKPGDIAVLYRSYKEGNEIAEAADALGLRYFRADNGAPIKRSPITEWLTDAARWCAGGWESGTITLSQLMKGWRRMRRSLSSERELFTARQNLVATLFGCRDKSLPLRGWLFLLHDRVLRELFEGEPGLRDEQKVLDDLITASGDDGMLKAYTLEIFGNQGRSPDQINLMTLHGCKGLEFEAVIMPGLEDGVIPNTKDDTKEKKQEAARLFYVGVTRAKSQVHLLYGYNESPFIAEIRRATGVLK